MSNTVPPSPPRLGAPKEGPDLAEYWRELRPHLWLVGLITLAVGGIVVAITHRQPRIFQAVCVIEYDPNPARPLGESVEDVSDPAGDFWASQEFFETQNRIIASRLIAERVVERLALQHDPTFLEDPESVGPDWTGLTVSEAAALLQSRLTVHGVAGTRLVELRVEDRDPERAATIANTIAETYIEKTIEDRLGSTVSALEWLGEQLDGLRHDLDESERALHAFKQDHNILSVSMEDRQNLVAADLEHFSTALADARTHRMELRARLARLRVLASADSVEARAAGLSDVGTVETLEGLLRTALAEHEALATRYGPEHPRIIEVTTEITALRAQLQDEIDGAIRAAEADLRAAGSMEADLRHAVEEANTAGLELNLWEIEFTQLTRERENNAELYETVLERTTETDLTRMLRTTHVRTVDTALAPTSPVRPRMLNAAGIGLGGGLVLGLVVALLLTRLDRRIKSMHAAEELGLSILGVVRIVDDTALAASPKTGRQPGPARRRANKSKSRSGASDVVVHTHPLSATAENFRTLRTNLMFASGDKPLRVLAVTSPNPREGKTTVTTNLAISIAQSGKRVLVIDADMRRPRIHHAFGVGGKRGLTSILVGDASLASAVQETLVPGLWVLACGPIPPNPAELLHRERFQKLMLEARETYDFVVCDSPPLGAVTDAAVLASQVDGTLVVVRAQQTTRDALTSVLRQLHDVGAAVVGGVLNGFDPRMRRYEYGNGYYYHYYRRGDYYGQSEDEGGGGDGGDGGGDGDDSRRSGAGAN